jgi:hypothetical protein
MWAKNGGIGRERRSMHCPFLVIAIRRMLKSSGTIAMAAPVHAGGLGAAAMGPFTSPKPGVAIEHVQTHFADFRYQTGIAQRHPAQQGLEHSSPKRCRRIRRRS